MECFSSEIHSKFLNLLVSRTDTYSKRIQPRPVLNCHEKRSFLIRQSHPGFWKVEMEMGTGPEIAKRWKWSLFKKWYFWWFHTIGIWHFWNSMIFTIEKYCFWKVLFPWWESIWITNDFETFQKSRWITNVSGATKCLIC